MFPRASLKVSPAHQVEVTFHNKPNVKSMAALRVGSHHIDPYNNTYKQSKMFLCMRFQNITYVWSLVGIYHKRASHLLYRYMKSNVVKTSE